MNHLDRALTRTLVWIGEHPGRFAAVFLGAALVIVLVGVRYE